MKVAISRVHFPVTTLGPGRRLGIWLQGCSMACPGCISVDTWRHGLGEVAIDELFSTVALHAGEADGLTVSGGEPFEQPAALAALLRRWRSLSDQSVLVFTGLELDAVTPWLDANPGLVDALVTGPFRSDVPQTLVLRGSDNQRIYILTPLGSDIATLDRPAVASDRRLDVMFDESGDAWMAGIPARGDVARLRRALAAGGTQAVTSADRGVFSA